MSTPSEQSKPAGDKQSLNSSGIYKDETTSHIYFDSGKSEESREELCGALYVLVSAKKPDGSGWCLITDITDREGETKQLQIPYKDMCSAYEIRRILLDAGLWVSTIERHGQLLATYLNNESVHQNCILVERTGWHSGKFITSCTEPESGYILTNGESCPPAAGSQTGWKYEVSALCVGNSRLVFSVSTAFASVLLQPTKTDSAIIHIEGPVLWENNSR